MGMATDVRFAIRLFWRTPLSSLMAVALLGVGISVSAIGRELARAPSLQGLSHPDEIATVGLGRPGLYPWGLPTSLLPELEGKLSTIDRLIAADVISTTLGREAAGPAITLAWVSPGFFEAARIRPHRGRLFSIDEYRDEGAPVVIVAHRMWRRELAARPDVLGSSVLLDGRPHVIVGVLPPGVVFPGCDAWAPMSHAGVVRSAGARNERPRVFATRAEGASWEDVRAEMGVLARALERTMPEHFVSQTIIVHSLEEHRGGRAMGLFLFFQGPPLLLLLVTILSVAGVLFSRAIAREHEIGVRVALGASTSKLARQFLIETLMLALPAGLLALALLPVELAALRSVPTSQNLDTLLGAVVMHRDTLAAMLIAALGAAALPALAPLLVARRVDLSAGLRRALVRPLGGFRRYTLRDLLVVFQVGAAFTLLGFAAFVARVTVSVSNPVHGYDRDALVVLQVDVGKDVCTTRCGAETLRLAHETAARIGSRQGIHSATIADPMPAPEPGRRSATIEFAGERGMVVARHAFVGADFFETLGLRLVRGRPITGDDARLARPVAVVSVSMAEELWPGRDALGQTMSVRIGRGSPSAYEIVGVAPDANHISFDGRSRRMAYLPLSAMPDDARRATVLVRARGDRRALLRGLRADLFPAGPDPSLRFPETYAAAERASSPFADEAQSFPFMLGILSVPALLALFVAVTGIASVTMESIVASRRGLAIRAAVGAAPGRLVRYVLGRSLVTVGLGLLLPLPLVLAPVLDGSPDRLPLAPVFLGTTFVAILAGGVAVVFLACYVPARVAGRVNLALLTRDE